MSRGLDQERKMDASITTGLTGTLDGMAGWAVEKWKALIATKRPANYGGGTYVYAARLDRAACVTRSYSGLNVSLKVDHEGAFRWEEFYDSARKKRSALGVFDSDGELLLECQIAPRGWEMTTDEAIANLKKELTRIGVDPDDL
jgi:hypothetical protein